ncbi:hypothetical protein [Oceanobacillus sp. 1P07AA]|uniref:hypothetical protein n=1 Tax=Oceanobacillus sp. 1P07AA TaxID=3132293 RepID=UPI0039A74531
MKMENQTGNVLIPLIVAPEASGDRLIVSIGKLLENNNFLFKSAVVINFTPEIVDFMYMSGPTNKNNRLQTIPWMFNSYNEYCNKQAAIVLLEYNGRPQKESTYQIINTIKGKSVYPNKHTLRSLSTLTKYNYSYVHIPDEDIVNDILLWAFPNTEDIKPIEQKNNLNNWEKLQSVLQSSESINNRKKSVEHEVVTQGLNILYLSRLRCLNQSSLLWDLETKNDNEKISILQRINNSIPTESFTGRRLKYLNSILLAIIGEQQLDLLIDLDSIFEYSGLKLSPNMTQYFRSNIVTRIKLNQGGNQ